jgi:hypothetical protein
VKACVFYTKALQRCGAFFCAPALHAEAAREGGKGRVELTAATTERRAAAVEGLGARCSGRRSGAWRLHARIGDAGGDSLGRSGSYGPCSSARRSQRVSCSDASVKACIATIYRCARAPRRWRRPNDRPRLRPTPANASDARTCLRSRRDWRRKEKMYSTNAQTSVTARASARRFAEWSSRAERPSRAVQERSGPTSRATRS